MNERVVSQLGLKFTSFKEETDPESEIYEIHAISFSFLKAFIIFPVLTIVTGVIIIPLCLYWSEKLRVTLFYSKLS